MVGRDHAGPRVARNVLAVDELEHGLAAAELQDQPPPGALDLLVPRAAGAAQDGRDLGQRAMRCGQPRAREHRLAAALQPLLRQRHHLDHALVGLARARPEGEDAVLVEQQALDLRLGVEHIGGRLGEAEARAW